MNSREEFEKWARAKASEHGYLIPGMLLKRDVAGDGYATTWVDSAWRGWQARDQADSTKVPAGWNIEMRDGEVRIDTPCDAHFQFARDSRMPNHALPNMLYDLARALLPEGDTREETE